MPESINDAEVESVLSAIRRLIVEGQAPAEPSRDPLVLSPSLRVAEPAPEEPEEIDMAEASPLVLLHAIPSHRLAPEPPPSAAAPEPLILRPAAPPERPVPPSEPGPDTEGPEPEPPAEAPRAADADEAPAVPMPDPWPDASLSLLPDPSDPAEAEPPPGLGVEPLLATPAGAEDGPVASDEDALRALVARLVQEELQGALGESFTRNLRGLVRREVLLALQRREAG